MSLSGFNEECFQRIVQQIFLIPLDIPTDIAFLCCQYFRSRLVLFAIVQINDNYKLKIMNNSVKQATVSWDNNDKITLNKYDLVSTHYPSKQYKSFKLYDNLSIPKYPKYKYGIIFDNNTTLKTSMILFKNIDATQNAKFVDYNSLPELDTIKEQDNTELCCDEKEIGGLDSEDSEYTHHYITYSNYHGLVSFASSIEDSSKIHVHDIRLDTDSKENDDAILNEWKQGKILDSKHFGASFCWVTKYDYASQYDKLYVCGFDYTRCVYTENDYEFYAALRSYLYDFIKDEWIKLPYMDQFRCYSGVTHCMNKNRIYVGGGGQIHWKTGLYGQISKSIEYYDFELNKYIALQDTKYIHPNYPVLYCENGNILYLIGNDPNDKKYFGKPERFDLRDSTNKWVDADDIIQQLNIEQNHKHNVLFYFN